MGVGVPVDEGVCVVVLVVVADPVCDCDGVCDGEGVVVMPNELEGDAV